MKKILALTAFTAALASSHALAQEPAAKQATAQVPATTTMAVSEGETISLTGQNQQEIGTVQILDGPRGKLLTVQVTGLSEGWHGFHVHETGDCSNRETFESAGPHAAEEGHEHGFLNDVTPHAGDLPNLWINEAGSGRAQYFVEAATWDTLRDDDGSAFVVHTGADDYKTDPSGESGTRVACGVIAPAPAAP